MISSTARTIGTLASRTSSRHYSTLLRSSASALESPGFTTAACRSKAQKSPVSAANDAINAAAASSTLASSASASSRRSFSSMMPRRGFPQYTIFGPESAMSIRASLPSFKRAGSDGVSVDRRGKLVLEFIPRNNTGAGYAWNSKTLFSLSVEEVGLLLSQLPTKPVEIAHNLPPGGGPGSDNDERHSGAVQLSGDKIEKVLTIDPGEAEALVFKLDYVMEGVGGQTPDLGAGIPPTPLEITIQAGEFEVVKSIFQTSIPYLIGWNTTMDIASAEAMGRAFSGGGY